MADVSTSTGPEHISCKYEVDGKHIVCSVDNMDVSFNVKNVVSWCFTTVILQGHISEKLRMRLIGRVSFYRLYVVVSFDPERSLTKLIYLNYGATTEQPKHLLKSIFGPNLTETPRQTFFWSYFFSVFLKFA